MVHGGKVLSFLRRRPRSQDWTQQELAEFYRVESALLQSGLAVCCDRGLSDEGDPWFVFCLPETEEIIAHFAHIDGYYLVVSTAFSGVARAQDFKALIRELMDSHPLMLPRNHGLGQKIYLHPAAVLAALVATSYLVATENCAAFQNLSESGRGNVFGNSLQFRNDFAIVAAVAFAATCIEPYPNFSYAVAPEIDGFPPPSTNHLSYLELAGGPAIADDSAPTNRPDNAFTVLSLTEGQTDGADWAPSLKLDILEKNHSASSETDAARLGWVDLLSCGRHGAAAANDVLAPSSLKELIIELRPVNLASGVHVSQPSLVELHNNPSDLIPTNPVPLDNALLSNGLGNGMNTPTSETPATSNSSSTASVEDEAASPTTHYGLSYSQLAQLHTDHQKHFYFHHHDLGNSYWTFSSRPSLAVQSQPQPLGNVTPQSHVSESVQQTASLSHYSGAAYNIASHANYLEATYHTGAVNQLAVNANDSSFYPDLLSGGSNTENPHHVSQNHQLEFAGGDDSNFPSHAILGILPHTQLHSV